MNNSTKVICLLTLFSLFFSCKQKQVNHVKTNEKTALNCQYSFDESKTKVFWVAYKTTDKLKVVGHFVEFTTNRTNEQFSSLEEMVNGIKFTINTSTSISNDFVRDMNLKDYFFQLFTDNFEINGSLAEMNEGSVTAHLDVLGLDKQIDLLYSLEENVLKMKGTLSLEEIGAIKAYQSIQEKCIHLHKGNDGISKTWDEVDVIIEVPILKDCK